MPDITKILALVLVAVIIGGAVYALNGGFNSEKQNTTPVDNSPTVTPNPSDNPFNNTNDSPPTVNSSSPSPTPINAEPVDPLGWGYAQGPSYIIASRVGSGGTVWYGAYNTTSAKWVTSWSSTNLVIVETNSVNALSGIGGKVEIGTLAWTTSIVIPQGAQVHGLNGAGQDVWYSSLYPQGTTSINSGYSVLDLSSAQLICFCVTSNGTIFAGSSINSTVYKSTDNGATWSASLTVAGGWDIKSLSVNSKNYIFASPEVMFSSDAGIWRTVDYGSSWMHVLTLNSTGQAIRSGVVSDSNGNLFAGLYNSSGTVNGGIIWKSTDDGATWNIVYNNQSLGHIHNIAIDQTNNYIYATTGDLQPPNNSPILLSTNGGTTWTRILVGATQATDVICGNGYRLFGSDDTSAGTIFRTTDDTSYSTVYTFEGNVYSDGIVRDPLTGTMFASFSARGEVKNVILTSSDTGLTWQVFDSVNGASDCFYGFSNFVNDTAYLSRIEKGITVFSRISPLLKGISSPTVISNNYVLGFGNTNAGWSINAIVKQQMYAGQPIFVNATGFFLASATSNVTMPAIGIAWTNANVNTTCTIGTFGALAYNSTWTWTAGTYIYCGTTAGSLTATYPSASGNVAQAIGVALSPTIIEWFNPCAVQLP